MLPIRKILCPTDFSKPSFKGVFVADEMASHFGAELILINVVTPIYPAKGPKITSGSELRKEMMQHAAEALEQVKAERITAGVRTKHIVVAGNAADEITDHAEQEGVDLLVIATHGRTGWRRFLFGSVTEKVIRLATCPLLIVPCPQEE